MKRTRTVHLDDEIQLRKRQKLTEGKSAPNQSTTTNTGLFHGLKIFFISLGIGPVHLNILQTQSRNYGAKLHHRIHKSTTHIISSLSHQKILDHLKVKKISPKIFIHSVEWISESIKLRRKLTNFEYRIYPSEFPTPSLPAPDFINNTNKSNFKSPKYLSPKVAIKKGISPIKFTPSPENPTTPPVPELPSPFDLLNSQSLSISPISPMQRSENDKVVFSWNPDISLEDEEDEDDIQSPIRSASNSVQSPVHIQSPTFNNQSFTLQFEDDILLSPNQKQIQTDDPPNSDDSQQTITCSPRSPNNSENDEWLGFLPPSSTLTEEPDFTTPDSSPKPTNTPNSTPKRATPRSKSQYFVCQKPVSPNPDPVNHNSHITDVLEKMESIEKSFGEQWRALAYRKAIAALQRYPKKIQSEEEAKKIRGIGSKISKKIAEIIKTGTLERLSKPDTRTQAFEVLSKVWGAGPETVKKWIAAGYYTITDLQNNIDALANNKQQQIGVKYYHEFLQRIPRAEVTMLQNQVRTVVQSIDKNLVIETCGSYRRGAADCGDIDILVTHQKGNEIDGVLEKIITHLHKSKFLSDDLSHGASDKYMGVCWVPPPHGSGIHRRIDIQLIPLDQWPLALLYFTGSAHFNRSMRLWARKNGYALSEKAITRRWVIAKGPTKQRESDNDLKGEPIPVSSEKDVFDVLGLTYVSPTDRSV